MRRNQGSALIVTMIVLAGLAAALAALAESQNVAAKEEIYRVEHAKAKLAAMDGVQYALSVLSQIVEPGGQSSNANTLSQSGSTGISSNNNTTGASMQTDDWFTEGQNGDVVFHDKDHTFRLQIVDACSLMNINCSGSTSGCNTAGTTTPIAQAQPVGASDAVLNNLPLLPQDIESIEDYRSASTTAQALGGKDPYYQNLQTAYNAKLLPFETFDELLQVQGLTAKLLYFPRTDVTSANQPLVDVNGNQEALSQALTALSVSPQVTPTGSAKVQVNAANGASGANNPTTRALTNLGMRAAIANQIGGQAWASIGQIIRTVTGASNTDYKAILNDCKIGAATTANGLLNINTASASVLELLPGMTTDIANAIVGQQSQGFLTTGDVTTVNGINSSNLAQFADQITATSQTFIIRVIGIAGSTSIPVEAVVTVTNDTPQIISIQEQPFSATEMVNRWTWDAETTTDTVLEAN